MNLKFYDGNIERIGYDFYCDIAINIVNERKSLGLTQEELAKKADIKLSRLSSIENIKYRANFDELESLAKALDITINKLINAELDSQIGECLYTVYPEGMGDLELYSKATSKRLAFLKLEKRLNNIRCSLFSTSRTRVIVKLVGKPITEQELQDKLPKFKENQEIEKED
ncbi:helix-turn-helix domain-containing protein [Clostridium perfringens]|uniref:helix-turn-helix domain-containing protein n=1 Tax=Clostridium perfringens TaxID=1502 RepID=UPI001B81B126|nr:helix-turn-helix transcriptional regulator [Clostridium perfringens]HBC2032343.1 helix-turn-helix transcriptional regulator [Clostridium perfringens]HBC2056078.1 helix-turn-helix transcriptional regulator [Clostridium perfringens]HBC2069693.1 helix-turn-helix transcriptional regulator [Clostridium perfringens]